MNLSISTRDGNPALDVKDHNVWAQDSRAARAYEMLDEATIGRIYETAASDFWRVVVPALAAEHGFDPANIYQTGRSGGWLVVHDTSFLDYLNDEDPWSGKHDADDTAPVADDDEAESYAVAATLERDRYLKFAKAIEKGMEAAGDSFIERLNEACDELVRRRETAIVLGEN